MIKIIIFILILLLLFIVIGAYIYGKKQERKWKESFEKNKERKDVFVLHKKVVRERPQFSRWRAPLPLKTYQIVGKYK